MKNKEDCMNYYNLSELPARNKGEGIWLRTVHGEKMTISYWEFDPQTDLPEHSHPHEQIAMLQEGRFVLTVEGESRELQLGEAVVIPPNVPHYGHAITASKVMDIFSPVREDLRE